MSNPLDFGQQEQLLGAAILATYVPAVNALPRGCSVRWTLTAIGKASTVISPVKLKIQAQDPSGNWYDIATTNDTTGTVEVEHSVTVGSGATVPFSCTSGPGYGALRCALVGAAAGSGADSLTVYARGF